MSTIGAAAALFDFDGDGLPNDVCYVETRTDQVIVAPLPGTPRRYKAFALHQEPFFNRDTMAPTGCLPVDVNEDGHPDLVVYYAGRTPLIFLWEQGDYVPQELVFGGGIWVTSSALAADLDGDGHLDLVFANYFADGSDIYNPHGQGTVFMPLSFSRAHNGGGLRVFRWSSASATSVRFTEVRDALPASVSGGWGLAVAACDLDGDLLPELYIANDFGPDRLLHNRSTPGCIRFVLLEGQRSFGTPSSKVLGRDSFKGMGVDFGDLNGDGIPDIYVSNITEAFAGQESQLVFLSTGQLDKMRRGIAPYVERGESLGLARSGWAWDCRLDDFDNDGYLEAVQATGFVRGQINRWPEIQEVGMANDALSDMVASSWPRLQPGDDVSGHDHNPFFVRGADSRFVDISGLIGFGEEYVSRGIATADVDDDGALDMVVANMWGPSTFYKNECTNCGKFLGLHLRLPLCRGETPSTKVAVGHSTFGELTRPAVGAAVTVTLADGRHLARQADGGNGHSGKRSPDVHFGLGLAGSPVTVDIHWRNPDGRPCRESMRLAPGWYTVVLGW